ncbi:MAG TPA: IS21 family transposase [Desulfatiglandales bacterium]|nr:IS21 family transposase [Desulfatiglandales bacterium]
MTEKQRIILEAVLEGKTKRQIAREMKISRTTVARYLREYEKAKSKLMESDSIKLKEDIISPPKYDTSKRVKVKLTDEIIEKIHSYLAENEEKRATGRSKQQKKKIDILEALRDEGHDIGYTTVCNAVREIERTKREAFIKQYYSWGDSAEFDWGEVKLVISGKLKIVQMGAFTPAKSNYRYADLYYTKKMENFLHLHAEFFSHMGGVYREIVYDNLRTAVAKFVGKSYKKPTEDLLKLSVYYNFRFRFCNYGKGNEKGHVEKSIEYVRRRVFSKRDSFPSLEEAREYLAKELYKLNQKPQVLSNGQTAENMLKVERKYLLPLPPKYDTARTFERRVNKYSTIEIDSSFYSVPDCYVGEFVFVKVYPDKVTAYYREEEVAVHKRIYGQCKWAIDIDHYRQTFLKKPGALANSLALLQAAPELKKIYTSYYIGSEKEFIELLGVISDKGLEKVKDAIARLESINTGSINTDSIKMIVQRNYDSAPRISKGNSQIEVYSKEILANYSAMLGSSTREEESLV